MSISVSGLGSGLDYDKWIEALVAVKQKKIDAVSSDIKSINTQESALTTLKSSYTSLLTSLQTFTDALSTTSVFNQKSATSSSSDVSVAVTSSAAVQNLKVTVEQLATSTTAKSASVAGSYVDADTKLSEISSGAVKDGYFSLYVNGAKQKITVDGDTTLGTLATTISNLTGVTASVGSDGKLTISGESSSDTLSIGASDDTSNFADVMALTQSDIGEGETKITSFTSSKSLFDTDKTATLTSANFAAGKVTAGKFTIGSAQFEVKSDTTLDSLISEINSNEDAGVSAYWDSNAGKLVLEATDGGAVNINVESDVAGGGSNFTYIMGLTSSDGKTLATNSQTLGTNAKLTINNTSITSSSNTVTSDISGIAGLTLTLNKETTSTATVAVTTDNSKATTAINAFVSAFNDVIANTDTATSKTGYLYGESNLSSIRNRLRTMISSSNGNETYATLAAIGITTGAIGTAVGENTNKLTVDSTKLTEALTSNPDAVKKLLLGDSTAGTEGIFSQMKTILDNSLDATNGYFVKREASLEKSVDRLNDKVDRMTTSLESYRAQLEKKFSAMDEIISNLKNQGSILDQYLNSTKKSDDDN